MTAYLRKHGKARWRSLPRQNLPQSSNISCASFKLGENHFYMKYLSLSLFLFLLACNPASSPENTTDPPAADTVAQTPPPAEPSSVADSTPPPPARVAAPSTPVPSGEFKATGNEPFWGLKVDFNRRVYLKSLDEAAFELTIALREPLQPLRTDGNRRSYRVEDEAGIIEFILIEEDCADSMSGQVSPYRVQIRARAAGQEDWTKYEGCGEFGSKGEEGRGKIEK